MRYAGFAITALRLRVFPDRQIGDLKHHYTEVGHEIANTDES